MINNPKTIGDQILNLAEGVGIKIGDINTRMMIDDDAYETFMRYLEGVELPYDDIKFLSVDKSVKENSPNLITSGAVYESIKNIPTISDIYSPESTDGMSGIAVAQAIDSYKMDEDLTLMFQELANNLELIEAPKNLGEQVYNLAKTVSAILNSHNTKFNYLDESAVLKNRTINNKPLSSDITLTPEDIGLTSVYTVKGTKNDYSDLPSDGNQVGDVWNVVNGYDKTPAGTNYVWTGVEWDALGGTIDMAGTIASMKADIEPASFFDGIIEIWETVFEVSEEGIAVINEALNDPNINPYLKFFYDIDENRCYHYEWNDEAPTNGFSLENFWEVKGFFKTEPYINGEMYDSDEVTYEPDKKVTVVSYNRYDRSVRTTFVFTSDSTAETNKFVFESVKVERLA